MSILQKKNLINFDMFGEDIEIPNKAIEKLIVTTNPAVMADMYRRTNKKNKAIQALQHKLNSFDRRLYSYEIVSTYIYFKDYEGALERIEALGFVDEPIERMVLMIFIHQHTHGKKILCGSTMGNEIISRAVGYFFNHFNLELFEYLVALIESFCKNNLQCGKKKCGSLIIDSFKERCDSDYLSKLSSDSLKYVYRTLNITEALRILVVRDPKSEETYFREFAKNCLPSKKELLGILERVYSPSLFKLLKKKNSLSDCVLELKGYYEREPPNEIKFDSIYCREINNNGGKLVKVNHRGKVNS